MCILNSTLTCYLKAQWYFGPNFVYRPPSFPMRFEHFFISPSKIFYAPWIFQFALNSRVLYVSIGFVLYVSFILLLLTMKWWVRFYEAGAWDKVTFCHLTYLSFVPKVYPLSSVKLNIVEISMAYPFVPMLLLFLTFCL